MHLFCTTLINSNSRGKGAPGSSKFSF